MFQSKSFKQYFAISFFILFIVNIVIIGTLYLIFINNEKVQISQDFRKKAFFEFSKMEGMLVEDFGHYKLLLSTLEDSLVFKQHIDDREKEILTDKMKFIAQSNKNIFQIRFLDADGLEKIRVDKDNHGKVTSAATLQDKRHRYYFTKTKSIGKDQFYVSDLDLNIEHGKIEVPYRPTIRISKPVYTKDDIFKGILIINYVAKGIIQSIQNKYDFKVYLVDHQQHFFIHPESGKNYSTQLGTDHHVKDEITKFDELVRKGSLTEAGTYYYLWTSTLTDRDFHIIYSLKQEIVDQHLTAVESHLLSIFLTLFIVVNIIAYLALKRLSSQAITLETIINNTPFPIFLKNAEGKLVLVNNKMVELSFFKEPADLLGKTLLEIMPESEAKKITQDISKVMQDNQAEDEIEFVTVDGKYYFDLKLIKLRLFSLLQKTYILGIAVDITKIKTMNIHLQELVDKEVSRRLQLESVIVQQKKMAEIGNMIGNILHQWKQPLSIISSIVIRMEMQLELGTINENIIKESNTEISQQLAFMNQTSQDFKSFFSPKKIQQKFNVAHTIAKIEKILKSSLIGNNIEIIHNHDTTITVSGYENELGQVLLSILNNAIDVFKDKQQDHKQIGIDVSKDKEWVSIVITDNGGQIPEELLPDKLFEMYFSTKDENGTGIGLYICRQIIEKSFNGTISAYNVNAQTAAFKIDLKNESS